VRLTTRSDPGFYYERWGDAPVHSIGAALFAKKEQILWFSDIGYRHEPFMHCPQEEEHTRGRCSCNPHGKSQGSRPCFAPKPQRLTTTAMRLFPFFSDRCAFGRGSAGRLCNFGLTPPPALRHAASPSIGTPARRSSSTCRGAVDLHTLYDCDSDHSHRARLRTACWPGK